MDLMNDKRASFQAVSFLGKAFVTFQCEYYRDYFLDLMQKNPNKFSLAGEKFTIEKAPNPRDVRWENLKM